jgi:3-oxoacyl-[acyl-carrier-protein] synthase II
MEGMRQGILLPTINLRPGNRAGQRCRRAVPLPQEDVLKNAFGFRGCNACLVFRHAA